MTINLEKGGRINLTKESPALKRVRFGLGWDANDTDTGSAYDLDVSVFVCRQDAAGSPKLLGDEYFVFYNNLKTPDGSVEHTGDSRTGDGDGDDETVIVDLTKLDPRAAEISVIVTIHDAEKRRQNFGEVSNSYIKLYDDETGVLVAQYQLAEEFFGETALQFGSLYKKDNQWLFMAVGKGFKKGLREFVVKYGGNV